MRSFLRRFCCAEGEQQAAQFGSVPSIDASGCAGREELLQVLEAEIFDYIICAIALRVSVVDPCGGLGCADEGTADIEIGLDENGDFAVAEAAMRGSDIMGIDTI